jgi:hypothetical protein
MTWFAFQGLNGGKAIDIAGVQEKDAVAWGFHGYATEAQAEAKPNSVNIATRIAADLLIADYHTAVSQGAQPGGPNASNPIAAGATGIVNSTGITKQISSVTDAIASIWDKLKDGKMWRSLGWLLMGVLLIIFGLVLWVGPTAFKFTPAGKVLG